MVAVLAVYGEFRGGLNLGHEAHRNRPVLVFPRAESELHYDDPRWAICGWRIGVGVVGVGAGGP